MMAILLAIAAVGCVMVAVSLMVQLDGAVSGDGRLVSSARSSARSVLKAPGSRAWRRDERKANPTLYLLVSVLALLVLAAIA